MFAHTGLYPKLLLFIPQAGLLHLMMRFYQQRHQRPTRPTPDSDSPASMSPSTSPSTRSDSGSMHAGSAAAATTASAATAATAAGVAAAPQATTSRRGAFVYNFATSLFPAIDETSPEYLRNMQNLQNMMGEVSDLYDAAVANMHYIDWSNEAETMRLLQLVLASTLGLALLVWFVPFHMICLVGGLSLFMVNTRFAKIILQEFLPHAVEYGQTQLDLATQWYTQLEKQHSQASRVHETSLFENQRWWTGSGFAPQVTTSDPVRSNFIFFCTYHLMDITHVYDGQ